MCAILREPSGRCPADAQGTARHDGYLTRESSQPWFPLLWCNSSAGSLPGLSNIDRRRTGRAC
jgi:hypothetical protein